MTENVKVKKYQEKQNWVLQLLGILIYSILFLNMTIGYFMIIFSLISLSILF